MKHELEVYLKLHMTDDLFLKFMELENIYNKIGFISLNAAAITVGLTETTKNSIISRIKTQNSSNIVELLIEGEKLYIEKFLKYISEKVTVVNYYIKDNVLNIVYTDSQEIYEIELYFGESFSPSNLSPEMNWLKKLYVLYGQYRDFKITLKFNKKEEFITYLNHSCLTETFIRENPRKTTLEYSYNFVYPIKILLHEYLGE